MKKVLVMVSDGFEEVEALAVVDILRRGSVDVEICGVGNQEPGIIKGSHNINVSLDIQVPGKPCDYDCLFLPGGLPNAHTLRDSSLVIEYIHEFFNSGKIISAICAAPCAFERAGVLQGRKVTSYPGCLEQIGDYEYIDKPVVSDGNIITGRSMAGAIEMGLTLLEKLTGKENADKIKKAIIY